MPDELPDYANKNVKITKLTWFVTNLITNFSRNGLVEKLPVAVFLPFLFACLILRNIILLGLGSKY